MKYITEAELMFDYRKIPFKSFQLPKTQRLTPGARQYLLDHNVKIDDESQATTTTQGILKNSLEGDSKELKKERLSWLSLREKFLETALILATKEPVVAQELFKFEEKIAAISTKKKCDAGSKVQEEDASICNNGVAVDLTRQLPLDPEKALFLVKLRQLYLATQLLNLEILPIQQRELQKVGRALAQLIAVF